MNSLVVTVPTVLAVLSASLLILYKLWSRPVLHSLINLSLGGMLTVFVLLGPALVDFSLRVLLEEDARSDYNCARFMEVRVVISVSLTIIATNLGVRFFFIVHADKGLVTVGSICKITATQLCQAEGQLNTALNNKLYVVLTVGLQLVQLLSWPGTVMLKQDYPANTVRGRICLGLRLDWDADRTKETSDIYIKPRSRPTEPQEYAAFRLIMVALTIGWSVYIIYFVYRSVFLQTYNTTIALPYIDS
jgi:hypothetical protein